MGSESGSGDGKSKQMLWIIPGSLLVLLVGYTLYTGQTIEEIGLGGLGSVKFAKPGNTPAAPPPDSGRPTTPIVHPDAAKQVDQDEMARRQADLEAKLRHMEEALKRSEARPVRRSPENESTDGTPPRQMNIAGTWQDRTGVSWVIQQTGNAVAVQELNPLLGVTAVGQGSISGHQLQLTYQSAMQTTGQAVLTISNDGRTLIGNARDNVTGVSFQLMFTR